MKLMKFLVVALVAGGVFAPVPSQASDLDSEIDGKAIVCEKLEPASGEINYGGHIEAYIFAGGKVTSVKGPGAYDILRDAQPKLIANVLDTYRVQATMIVFDEERTSWILNRKTLAIHAFDWIRDTFVVKFGAVKKKCELIDPDKIDDAFQPYIGLLRALYDEAQEGNKI